MGGCESKTCAIDRCEATYKPVLEDAWNDEMFETASFSLSPDQMVAVMVPGDVLLVRGTGGLAQLMHLGTAGGAMGHMMLVTASPQCVSWDSEEARLLDFAWPQGAEVIWKVRTLEICRQKPGLHEADVLLYVEDDTRRIQLLGELGEDYFEISGESVEVWQSPEELRGRLSQELVVEVLDEMRVHGADWSWNTALHAVLQSRAGGAYNDLNRHNRRVRGKERLLQEIQASWIVDPICTSVVISFWQRCLCKSARSSSEAADLVLQWMPQMANGSLPGVLLGDMKGSGWTSYEGVDDRALGLLEICSGHSKGTCAFNVAL